MPKEKKQKKTAPKKRSRVKAKKQKGKVTKVSRRFAKPEVLQQFMERARPRGFVTHDEILYQFPGIERDVFELESLYSALEKEGIRGKGIPYKPRN